MGPLSPGIGPRPYLDANVVIYVVEGHPDYPGLADALAEGMDAGGLRCITSMLTLAEVLVRPKRERDPVLELAFREFPSPSDAVIVSPITERILDLAAELRAHHNVRLPDAIHAATALVYRCTSFLTNDSALRALPDLNVVLLSQALE